MWHGALIVILLSLLLPCSAYAAGTAPNTAPIPTLQPQEGIDKKLPSSPVTKREAEKYYLQCVNNVLSLQQLNPYQRDYLCSCVSVGLPISISSDELKDITQNISTPAGQDALHIFLNEVYMPCALQPLQETIWNDCINRAKKNGQFAETAVDRCQCFSKQVLTYAQKMGSAETEYDLARSHAFSEPFDVLTGATGFSEVRTKSYMACFNGLMP